MERKGYLSLGTYKRLQTQIRSSYTKLDGALRKYNEEVEKFLEDLGLLCDSLEADTKLLCEYYLVLRAYENASVSISVHSDLRIMGMCAFVFSQVEERRLQLAEAKAVRVQLRQSAAQFSAELNPHPLFNCATRMLFTVVMCSIEL